MPVDEKKFVKPVGKRWGRTSRPKRTQWRLVSGVKEENRGMGGEKARASDSAGLFSEEGQQESQVFLALVQACVWDGRRGSKKRWERSRQSTKHIRDAEAKY